MHDLYTLSHCTVNGKIENTNPVTGKVTVRFTTTPCSDSRSLGGECKKNGDLWEPNDIWLNDKKNCFKILVNMGE